MCNHLNEAVLMEICISIINISISISIINNDILSYFCI